MTRVQRVLAAAVAVVLAQGISALVQMNPATGKSARPQAQVAPIPPARYPVTQAPPSVVNPGNAAPVGATRGSLLSTDESGSATIQSSSSSSSSSSNSFAAKYPAQWNAQWDPAVPATNYWALLVGINDYAGSTRDNVGSYQDARDLRAYLLKQGWRSDHIVFIANRDATATRIVQGIRWLAWKANSQSTAIFHYSGHEKPVHTTADGDSEAMDVALWVADNKLIVDGALGKELGRVNAARMWINMAVCRAAGFSDAGMVKSGRILTFSSVQSELSYEDPKAHHSVFGWYMIMEAMTQGLGDADRNGQVTVEEAYAYARPYVTYRTGNKQHPAMSDKFPGQFSLRPPAPEPAPAPPPDDGGTGGGSCTIGIFCVGSAPKD